MKVEIDEQPKTRKYPYIGKSKESGKIVLFTKTDVGMLISDNMHTHQHWAEQNFEPFTGTITLSND